MEFSTTLVVFSILVTVLATIAWCFFQRDSNDSSENLPPGPFNLPLLGALPFIGALPHVSLHNMSRKHGGIMFMKLGTVPHLIISSTGAAQELYKRRGLELGSSRAPMVAGEYFSRNFSGFAFKDYSPEVKLYRKLMISHLLGPSRIKSGAKDRMQDRYELVDSVRSEDGRPFELVKKLHVMNMNTAGRMMLGKRFYEGETTPEFMKALIESIRVLGKINLSDIIPMVRWMDLQGLEKQYEQLCSKIHPHLLSLLQEYRRKPLKSDGDLPFIETLISMDSTDERVSDDTKIALLTVSNFFLLSSFFSASDACIQEILIGAIDTSAATTEWGMTELLRHRDMLRKAQDEVRGVVGDNGRLVDESDLPNLPLIEAISKETLRLHPPSPLALPKIVFGGATELSGYKIPSRTWVYINVYAIGRDEEYWECPEEFKPERFLHRNVDVFGQDFTLLPFGSGRRGCPGAKLGYETLALSLATLLQVFDWETPDDEIDMGASFGVVCSKTKPLG